MIIYYAPLTMLNSCLTIIFGWCVASFTIFDTPKSARMKSRNSSAVNSSIMLNSLSHSSSVNPTHLFCTFPAELIFDSIALFHSFSYGTNDASDVSPFFMASAATWPATSPNLIAYLIPSRTSGFAWPAESPTRIKLS